MKCTNRVNLLFSITLTAVFTITGCGKQSIDMAYDPNIPISSFSISGTKEAEAAEAFASALCVTAEDVTAGTEVDMTQASAAGLFDLNNKKVIYAKNVHEKLYPASLTKVMTALVALKYVALNQGNLDDMITVTKSVNITESGAVLCGLKEGDTLTLDQALNALLIHSANDAGVAIAEHIAGSVDGFAAMMNEEAKAIGATNSHFVNPHGLSDDNHFVTAYDMYLIFNEALKYERFVEIIQTTAYTTSYHDKGGAEKTLSFETSNQYLKGTYNAPDKVTVIGGKTGTTNAAGNCLIIYTKDVSGNSYISVILRSKERTILYEEMSDLLDEI